MSVTATAQNRYRYWFDTPDNVENALYGMMDSPSESRISLDASSLDPSIHTLSFQIENEDGSWGDVRTAIFIRAIERHNGDVRCIRIFVDHQEFVEYPVSSLKNTFTLDLSELASGIHYVDLYLATTTEILYSFGGSVVVKAPVMPSDPVAMIVYVDGDEYETYRVSGMDDIVNVDVSKLAVGDHTIFAVVEDSMGNRFPVEEKTFYWGGIKVVDLQLDVTAQSLFVGDKFQLTATVLPENATDKTVEWSSLDESIASVDSIGCVTAISPGLAIITASCGGFTAQCAVTVDEKMGIASIHFDGVTPIKVYSLQGIYIGEYLNAAELNNLPHDIYIVRVKDIIYKVKI
ncbi:MAG: Ig-like domain-containing protein [Muribaculum sp.]|nr:Ig-like domain-containing protein [Muribaculum sp.]